MTLAKTKQYAKILCAASAAVFLWLIGNLFFTVSVTMRTSFFKPDFSVIVNIVMILIAAAIIINVFFLLLNIARGETPFAVSSVRRLKSIGILLISVEPIQLILQFISNRFFSLVSADGIVFTKYSSLGGFVFAAGLAVLCVSFIFGYGAELQKQSDETL